MTTLSSVRRRAANGIEPPDTRLDALLTLLRTFRCRSYGAEMSRHHSDAEMIARNMTVSASAVLDRQFNPATYPHRHIAIRDEVRLGGPETLVPRLMAAVEGLAQAGWELVTVARVGDRALIAVLRR